MGREFYGVSTGGAVTTISETVTEYFSVNSTFVDYLKSTSTDDNDVTIVWNAMEGGTYTVETSSDLSEWDAESTTITPTENELIVMDSDIVTTQDKKFYRILRKALATSDTLDGAGSNTTGLPGGGPPGGGPPR